MFKIFRNGTDDYFVSQKGMSFTGNMKTVFKRLVERGIIFEEIEMGIIDLELNDLDIAEYGMFGRYMFSTKVNNS